MTLLPGDTFLETERLTLRRMDPTDLDFFAEIHADPDVARYLGNGNERSREETARWLDDIFETYARANLGQLAVVRRADGALIGRCGLSDVALEAYPQPGERRKGWFFSRHVPEGTTIALSPELGYAFSRKSWGQGYATEAAGCVYRYARTALSFQDIMSVVHPDNIGSRTVVKKFGAAYVEQVEMAGRGFDRFQWPLAPR
jgi:[ribosomal protein S5]-alanine N-acetyltransferase